MRSRFPNRTAAGQELAEALRHLTGEWVVLGVPRGGVPPAAVVAAARGWPLDVVVVQKVGFPGQPELGVAAISEGDVLVPNPDLVPGYVSTEHMQQLAEASEPRLLARIDAFRSGRTPVVVRDANVIIVDDGIATGVSTRAAIRSVRQRGAKRVVLAVPVAPRETVDDLVSEVDELVVLESPRRFQAVGAWYEDFGQVATEEVNAILAASPDQPAS